MKTITVLGNNSGRNAGDNAILGNLLYDFSLLSNDILFKIPTINTKFLESSFGKYNIQAVSMMPWNFAIRNLGIPMYKSMTKTDAVLITDNILFDRKLNNPLFNNLKSISLFSKYSKKKDIPIILYNASIGPIDHPEGEKALRKVLDACPLAIVRDNFTKELIERISSKKIETYVHADSALNTQSPDNQTLEKIIRKNSLFKNKNGTIGLNVNAYIGNWSKKENLKYNSFCEIIANSADKIIQKLGVDILFTITQIMDTKITHDCIDRIKNKDKVRVIGNDKYTYNEIAAILAEVDVHAGLRTHTLIFCAAFGTPMISITAYPKSIAFLDTIGMKDWNVDLKTITVNSLTEKIFHLWENKDSIRSKIKRNIITEKIKARKSAELVLNHLK